MIESRVTDVADVIATLGYEGIIAFDREKPEYETFSKFFDEYLGDKPYIALLGICAGTEDYQLAGNAQEFLADLEKITLQHGDLSSVQDVRDILGTFMETNVNARLNQQKRDRLIRMFENGFDDWFVNNDGTVESYRVWEDLAGALETQMKRKTIVFAMKVYGIIHLLANGEYLDFPSDIPIPCDLQVERVAQTAGLVKSQDEDEVMNAWAEVTDQVGAELGRNISLLRIDSIVWQSGQIFVDILDRRVEQFRGLSENIQVEAFPRYLPVPCSPF